ncbi:MAG: septum formation initiator family protein [Rikenellaceae bacterium]|nr:septum formation initiator family protein [Rikenellaceae bacterium]MBR2419771.1 septum formation initiator family protein [Rikenellaceae bacterium]MBR3800778.1 septum formation initiator family protein [Rikenellaceae bacterium]
MSQWYRSKRFWIIVSIIAVFVMVFTSGRYVVKCVELRRDISALKGEVATCRAKIAEDSTMLENLKYDEYIEAYAREHYNLQKKSETVYILKD